MLAYIPAKTLIAALTAVVAMDLLVTSDGGSRIIGAHALRSPGAILHDLVNPKQPKRVNGRMNIRSPQSDPISIITARKYRFRLLNKDKDIRVPQSWTLDAIMRIMPWTNDQLAGKTLAIVADDGLRCMPETVMIKDFNPKGETFVLVDQAEVCA